jgi:alpha-1,6-mannosyltransferase
MRIAQLANFYAPTSGGLRVAVDQLRAGYQAAGDDATLIVPGSRHRVGDGLIEIAAPSLPNGSGYRVIVSHRAVLDALEHADPDLIEVHDKLLQRWVWRWAQQHSVPVVAVSHERLDATLAQFLPRVPDRARARAARFVAGRVLAEADRVVTCSAFSAAEFHGAHTVRVVPLGVDLQRFTPGTDRGEHPVLRLISVGRLSAEKRPDLAIATLAELIQRGVKAELTLLGGGPWERRLRAQAAGLPVRFAGFVTGVDSVAARLAAADIALAPGPAETFGLATLEGLACGTPIIAVSSAATAEFVATDPQAGRATTLDPVAFADAVMSMLEVPVAERRQAARAVAERYSWAHTVDAMRAVHSEVRHIWSAPWVTPA